MRERPISDQLQHWLSSDGEKTLGSLIDVFEEKSFAILFVFLLGVPALPLPTGGVTHVFEVIAVLGDGSSLYTIQGLWSAAQLKLPITFVILNNAGYAAVKSLGERMGIARMPGSDVPGVDFVDVARGFGCRTSRVERAVDLAQTLAQAYTANEPWLIDVRMDRAVQKLY